MKKNNIINKEKNLKKSISIYICIICIVLSLVIGSIMANAIHTEISIPLGIVMIYLPFVIIGVWFIKIGIKVFFNLHVKGGRVTLEDVLIVIIGFFVLFKTVNYVYLGSKDIIKGQKEVVLSNVFIKDEPYRYSTRHGSKVGHHYYIVGYSNETEKKILIRGNKMRTVIEGKIENSNVLKVYYHENLNIVYEVY